MKRYINTIILSLLIVFLLASCNADIFTANINKIEVGPSIPNSTDIFTGEAPKNLWASQALFRDKVMISCDSVPCADYYVFYRAEIDRNLTSYNYDNLEWRVAGTKEDLGKERVIFEDNLKNLDRKKDDVILCYVAQAKSYWADSNGLKNSKTSNVVEGWTLSPPISLSASQGSDEKYIELQWNQVNLVSGYKIYYHTSSDAAGEVWTSINQIIPSTGSGIMNYRFEPDSSMLGQDIYFRVVSVSRGGEESDRSSFRNGYTYVPGAPAKPENVKVSKGDYKDKITVEWTKPKREDETDGGYTWEVSRVSKNTDPKVVLTFSSKDFANTDKVVLENGKYIFTDIQDLEPTVEYEYSIRATCDVSVDGEIIPAPGVAATATGSLLSPPTDILYDVNYPNNSSGGFTLHVNKAPVGFSDDRDWSYRFYGRFNNGLDEVGEWTQVGQDISVTAGVVSISIDFGVDRYNDFTVTTVNEDGVESIRYDEYVKTPIQPDIVTSDSVQIDSNRYNDKITANANGVYPVCVAINNPERVKTIHIKVTDNANNVRNIDIPTSKIIADGNSIGAENSPSEPGIKYSYEIQAESYFGRFSKFSSKTDGWGALTGYAYTKFFEMYGLKPWEFCGKSYFPEELNDKWNKSEIKNKIDNEATSANITEYSNYHNGKIIYTVKANMATFQGDIRFNYSNFGEHSDFLIEDGMYQMSVGLSGTGSISANNPFIIEGMYPGVIKIDPSEMSISSKNFSGRYIVEQANGSNVEYVGATSNK